MSLTKDDLELLNAIAIRDGADKPLNDYLPMKHGGSWITLRRENLVTTLECGDCAGITVITPKGRESLAQGEENG